MKTLKVKSGMSMLTLALSLLSVLLWTGCTKPDLPTSNPTLTVDVTEVTIAPEGETVKIPIVTNSELAAPICSHDWITAEITDDNGVLQISAGSNIGKEGRQGNVTLKTKTGNGNDVSKTIKVTQGFKDAKFEFDQKNYNLGYAPSSTQASLISEGKWEIDQVDLPGWLEITPTSGDGNATITVKYKSNVSLNERTTQIMFKNLDYGNAAVLRLTQAGHPKGLSDFSHLGKGYDACGTYANEVDVRAAVLDCDKLYNASHIADPLNTFKTEEMYITGNSREEYISNYAVSAGVSAHAFGFSASVEANFSQSALSSQENCFATYRNMTKTQIIKVHDGMTPEMLKDCHTTDFDKDVTALTTDQLVEKYGTHVIMGLALGGVLEYSMTADATAASKSFNLNIAAKAGYEGMAYGGSVSGGYDQFESMNTEEALMEQKLVCRGGASQFASSGFGSKDTFDRWLESLNDPNKWVMINYEGSQLISLDQFISDPVKAAEVKTYIDDLLSTDRLPALGSRYRKLKITVHDLYFRGANYVPNPVFQQAGMTIDLYLDGKKTQKQIGYHAIQPKENNEFFVNFNYDLTVEIPKVNAKIDHELKIDCWGQYSTIKTYSLVRTYKYAQSQLDEKWQEVDGNLTIGNNDHFYIYDQYDSYSHEAYSYWEQRVSLTFGWSK